MFFELLLESILITCYELQTNRPSQPHQVCNRPQVLKIAMRLSLGLQLNSLNEIDCNSKLSDSVDPSILKKDALMKL